MGRELTPLTESGKQRLRSYAWPGNVRELQNAAKAAIDSAEFQNAAAKIGFTAASYNFV